MFLSSIWRIYVFPLQWQEVSSPFSYHIHLFQKVCFAQILWQGASEIATPLKSVGNLPFTITEPGFHTKFISIEDQTESSPVFVKCFEVESVAALKVLLLLLLLLSAWQRRKVETSEWTGRKYWFCRSFSKVSTWHFSKQFPLKVSSKILFQPKYFLGMLIRSRSSYQAQPTWLKTSYLFLCILFLELYYWSLRINWNTLQRA